MRLQPTVPVSLEYSQGDTLYLHADTLENDVDRFDGQRNKGILWCAFLSHRYAGCL